MFLEIIIIEMFLCSLLDVHCSSVKPTTPPAMLGVDVMKIKITTKPSTRMETTQLSSSQRPSPTKLTSTQTPREPEVVGYLEKEKEAAVTSGRYYS